MRLNRVYMQNDYVHMTVAYPCRKSVFILGKFKYTYQIKYLKCTMQHKYYYIILTCNLFLVSLSYEVPLKIISLTIAIGGLSN